MANKTETALNSKKYFIGMDGGGTKTAVSMLDDEGRLIFSEFFGPSNLLNGKEFEETVNTVIKTIAGIIKNLTREKAVLEIISGFAGISSNDHEERFRSAVKRSLLGRDITSGTLIMMSDALLALEVYFPSGPGLLLISGTGSICYGKDKNGKIFRTGGFGYLIDDLGSGFWFGKEAVRAALYSRFHYNEKSVLEDLIFKHFGLSQHGELLDLIYKNNPKMIIASASELVFIAAGQGCPVAEKIIARGTDELVYLAINCSELIGNSSPCVMLHGSVFKQETLSERIRKQLQNRMNVYLSDKRIDLDAANLIYERSQEPKEP